MTSKKGVSSGNSFIKRSRGEKTTWFGLVGPLFANARFQNERGGHETRKVLMSWQLKEKRWAEP
jgi:hypothetical protein